MTAKQKLADRIVGGSYSQLANYSDLFNRTQDAILLVDSETGEILEGNPAAQRVFKRTEWTDLNELFLKKQTQLILNASTTAVTDISIENHIFECLVDQVRLSDYCVVKQVILRDVTLVRKAKNLLEKQSLTDEMTGLRNFRSFKSRMALEFERSKKKNTPLSVIFCDIDHFKHFNDKNGHPAGDEALKQVAKIIYAIAGEDHFTARYGGEEFVILCAGFTAPQAFEIAEKVRKKLEETVFNYGQHQPLGKVTLSLGVASNQDYASTPEALLKAADEALYLSKKNGRNRATIAGLNAAPNAAPKKVQYKKSA